MSDWQIKIVFDGDEAFVIADGKRIARRGSPGTRHANTWIPLEPGYTVRDCDDGEAIEVEYKDVRVQ